MSAKKTVFVIYYSTYGHVHALARAQIKGLERAGGVNLDFSDENLELPFIRCYFSKGVIKSHP